MGRNRITIASLMVLGALVAVVIAACRDRSTLAASALPSLAYGLNLLAVAAAIACAGWLRAAADGFAVGGWGYFVPTFTSIFGTHQNAPLFTSCLVDGRVKLMRFDAVIFDQECATRFRALLTIGFGVVEGTIAWVLAVRPPELARPTHSTMDQR